MFCSHAASQTLLQDVSKKYRNSTVFLKVKKITNKGDLIEENGSGFILSERGYILTSCHTVDLKVLDDDGKPLPYVVDSISIEGAIGSRYAQFEPIEKLRCANSDQDIALLKFRNPGVKRVPIPVSASFPEIGDQVASLGYPKLMSFFAKQGTVGGDTDGDLIAVDMTLSPGDSGSPVLNTKLQVIGIVEGGQDKVGVVRPIRHASGLLADVGISLYAENVSISSTVPPDAPRNSNISVADKTTALQQFVSAKNTEAPDSNSVKVTYAVSKSFQSSNTDNSNESQPEVLLSDVHAKPGYKIVAAKFIVTDKVGTEVAAVNPTVSGNTARATILKQPNSPAENAFMKGYIETTQIKNN